VTSSTVTPVSTAPLAIDTGRRGLGRPVRWALNAMLVVAVAMLLFLAVGPRVLPYRTVTMLTGSMAPVVPSGALVVDTALPVEELRTGDVITFEAPVDGHPVVTHRVVAVERHDGRTFVRTRGDANTGVDPWLAEVHGTHVWKVRGVVPHLGDVIRVLRSAQQTVALLWVVPGIVLVWFLVGLWRRPGAPEGGEPQCEPYPAEPAQPSLPASSSSPFPVPQPRGRRRRPPARRLSLSRPRRSSLPSR
jgi:signal peptidase